MGKKFWRFQLNIWIDSHAHLAELREAELHTSINTLCAVLNIATDLKSSYEIITQASRSKTPMYCAVGISAPDVAKIQSNSWEKELGLLAKRKEVIAIGETGYDGVNESYPSIALQKEIFRKHIALACENDLPLILHSRGVDREVLEICKSEGVTRALFHCYTGSDDLIQDIMEAGYYVSLSGIVTFKNSGLDSVVTSIWDSRILIETDSPYLAPVPHRGMKNVPNNVGIVGEYVAGRRGVDKNAFAKDIKKNFETLFCVSID